MEEFFKQLLGSDFMPHGHCYFWQPGVLWLNVGSDVAIGLAYFSIPIALFSFVRRRRDLAFPWIFGLFAAFIFACGTTHLFEVWTVWNPVYRLEGVIKLLTALVSVATAVVLWPLIKPALALPSPAELEGKNRQLQKEIADHEHTQRQLRQLNAELEQRVEERTEALRRSNEDLQQFAYVASHDLQEPLRMVSSYMQLLQKRYGGQLDEKADKYIHYAVDGAHRMRTLISELLTYSRSNTSEQKLESVDLNAVVDRARDDLSVRISEEGAHVSRDALPTIRADETQLHQVMVNLLTNALRYRRTDATPEVHVSAEQRDGSDVVSVSDNGIGIDPAYREQIFEIFQRLRPREREGGSGMGLAICKRLVERHGGRIWVDSTPGHGATFRFTLPRDTGI